MEKIAKASSALLGHFAPSRTFEEERLRDDANGQDAQPSCHLGDDRRASRAGATAHSGSDEDHVAALELFMDGLLALFGRRFANFGIAAGSKSSGRLLPESDSLRSGALGQGLGIRVHRDKLNTRHALVDHAVDGIAASTANSEDLDRCLSFEEVCWFHSAGRSKENGGTLAVTWS